MPAFVYDNCCYCIDLKTGSFIIGYLHLVVAIVVSIGCVLFIAGGGVLANDKTTDDDLKAIALALVILCSLLLVFILVLLAFTVTLLVGLHKNKRGHVNAFLIYYGVFIVLYFVGFKPACSRPGKPPPPSAPSLKSVGGILVAVGGSLWVAEGGFILLMNEKPHEGEDRDVRDVRDIFGVVMFILIISVITLVLIAVLVTFTIVLLAGLYKNRRGYVKAYLIFDAIFVPLLIGFFVASLSSTVGAAHVICGILVIVLEIYFKLVINCQYFKMKDSVHSHGIQYAA